MAKAELDEFMGKFKHAMELQARPREEVAMARRLMAHELGQSLGTEQLCNPLSLIDDNIEVSAELEEAQGAQREYLEAVKRNLKARDEFTKLQKEHRDLMASMKPREQADRSVLDLHIRITELQQRRSRLLAAQKYLDRLDKQPAAAPDFLDPKSMYKDCCPLPEIPQKMVNGFAVDHESTDAEVQQLLQQLQKTVLRSKLVYRREKQQFDRTQASNPIHPKDLDPGAKLQALNTVKNTLINWIESQLSKAGDKEEEEEAEKPKPSSAHTQVDHEAQLVGIQKEYERHIRLRKEILALLSQKDQMTSKKPEMPTEDKTGEEEVLKASPSPTAYLLTPYLEKLHTLSREQKILIQQKSHINGILTEQQEYSKLTLDQLAQESQLLEKYPPTKATKSKLSFGEATKASGKSSVVNQVQPWIYAADSAKIATLETVAEKVEEGMMLVDESRQTLKNICRLLNMPMLSDDKPEEVSPEKDLWLPDDDGQSAVKATKKTQEETKPAKTIWEILDGNLGSINE